MVVIVTGVLVINNTFLGKHQAQAQLYLHSYLFITMNLFGLNPQPPSEAGEARMNMMDLANLLDNDGNLQNEMMVAAFAATMLATIPVLLGNEFDVNVGLKKRSVQEDDRNFDVIKRRIVSKFKNLIPNK